MAYHLQKMQGSGIKREDMRKNTIDYREQDGPHYECENIKGWCSYVESACLCIYVKDPFTKLCLLTFATCFVPAKGSRHFPVIVQVEK